MARDFAYIVEQVTIRRQQDLASKRQMQEVRARVNGDYVISLKDVVGKPIVASTAPQLIADAIDNAAMRAASTRPQITVPRYRDTQVEQKLADTQRRALTALWNETQFTRIGIRRAFRHLAGYGTMCLSVEPWANGPHPTIAVRDPLFAYPTPRPPEDTSLLEDCAFLYLMSPQRAMSLWPQASKLLSTYRQDSFIEVLEWVDREHIVMGLLGAREETFRQAPYGASTPDAVELTRIPNRTEVVPVTCGSQVTLDQVRSSVSRVVNIADLLDRFTALEAIAAERAVFPDRYVIGREGREPQIIGGEWVDGRLGRMNVLFDVQSVGELNTGVGGSTREIKSSLERAARLSGGNPGLFSGELTGSLRSGQTVNALGAFSVDPRVAEMQELMAAHLEVVNDLMRAVGKAYHGPKTISMHSGRQGDNEIIKFQFDEFDDRPTAVTYAFPGSDITQITVALSQAVGSRMMSTAGARERHPLIDDPQAEGEQLHSEMLEEAVLSSLTAQAAQGQLPLADIARITQLRRQGKSLVDAILQTQTEAQERQARESPAGSPELMPGLSMPGTGVEGMEAPPEMPSVADNLSDVGMLAMTLASPARQFGGNPVSGGGAVR